MGQYTETLQKLYVAYFNRPADPDGLKYWSYALQYQNIPLSDISNAFATSQEYQIAYAGLSNQQVVNQVYVNLFGRNAEAGGLQYWAALLDDKKISVANVVTIVGNAALNEDLIAYNAKTAAATSFTTGLERGYAVGGYNTPEAQMLARNFIAGVTDEASLALARAEMQSVIDKIITPEQLPAGMQLLTKGIDLMTGGDGVDMFLARSDGMASTLQAGDKLDGGAGLDSLTIDIANRQSFATPNQISIKNIEIVTLNSNGQVELNTTAWQGVKQLSVTSIGTTTLMADSATAITSKVSLRDGSLSINGGKDVTVQASDVVVQATSTGSASALEIGVQQAPTGKVVIHSTLQSADSTEQHAGKIVVHGGSEIRITQVSNDPLDSYYRPASAVSITGTDITTRVSSSAPLASYSDIADQALQITDVHAHSSSKLGSITSVQISGHSTSTIASNALTNLEVNKVYGTVTIDNGGGYQGAAQTLALNLTNSNVSIVDKNVYSKVDITLSGAGNASSLHALGGKAMQSLSVSGSGELSLGEDFATSSLQSISVNDGVFLRLPTFATLPNLRMLDLSASTGGGSASFNGSQTTFVGGSGKESISVLGTSLSKNIDLGAEDDTMTLAGLRISSGTLVNGGSGTDTIYMHWSDAATFLVDAAVRSQVQGFEVLSLQNPGKFANVDLRNAPLFDKVEIGSLSAESRLSLNNVSNNVTITCATSEGGSLTVAGTTATDGASSSVSVNTYSQGKDQLNLTMSNIEQIKLYMVGEGGFWHTPGGTPPPSTELAVNLRGDQAQSLSLSGSSGVKLDFAGAALKNFDATLFTGHSLEWTAGALQGNVIVKAPSYIKTSIDLSKASAANVSYFGSSGADILTLAGGANTVRLDIGADVLTISAPGKDSSTYTTVLDAHQGMKIVLPNLGSTQFTSTKLQVANAQTLTNYLDGAIASLGNAASNAANGWFQFQGDTYYVQSRHDGNSNAHFVGGTDIVVKLTGLLDLSQAQLVGNSLSLV